MRKLYRSRNNKMFTGLCGGLAEMTNIDATLYRVLVVVLSILSSGTFALIYFIVSLVIPKVPDIHSPFGTFNKTYGGQPPYGYGGPNHHQNNMHQQPHTHQDMYGAGNPNQQWSQPYNTYGAGTPPNQPSQPTQPPFQSSPINDKVMEDLEKKALKREIDELKAKISELEKGE